MYRVIQLAHGAILCKFCFSSCFESVAYCFPQDRREYKKFLDDMHTGDFTPVSSDYYTCGFKLAHKLFAVMIHTMSGNY